jgi:hypothetical protein
MCPDCISVIAVAVVAAAPPRFVKTLLARAAERIATQVKTTFASSQAKESFRYDYHPKRTPERRLA